MWLVHFPTHCCHELGTLVIRVDSDCSGLQVYGQGKELDKTRETAVRLSLVGLEGASHEVGTCEVMRSGRTRLEGLGLETWLDKRETDTAGNNETDFFRVYFPVCNPLVSHMSTLF